MKKKLSIILSFLICITTVMLAFLWTLKPKSQASADSLIFEETDLVNKVDIVDPTSLGVSFLNDKVENQTPFDNSTMAMMPGYAIVPKTVDSLKSINSTYVVDSFSVDLNESIYMWIFIPDENIYSLEVSFSNGNNKISWNYSRTNLNAILDNNSRNNYIYGWRLFEFCLSDAVITDELKNDLQNYTFNSFNIKYTNTIGTYIEKNKNSFSFYHIYKANSYSSYSKIIDGQNYVQYKFNNEFVNQGGFFIDDEILFTNLRSIFMYLVVGQVNLIDVSNSNYSFEISVEDPNGEIADKYFGEKYVFDTMGYHKIIVKIKEYRADGNAVVFFEQLSIYVDYFAIGSFTNVDYRFEKGETTAITFKFSSAFNYSNKNEIEIQVSDKTIAKITNYKIEGNTCYIEVEGLKNGEFNLVVKAKGQRTGTVETKTFSLSTKAKVVSSNQKSSTEIFLWVILCVYGVGFTIFMVILLVKARRVSVK